MKLKDDFFKVTDVTGIDYKVELNPEHYIYQAHFPGNPITPGVCIIQIIKELYIEIVKHNLFLKKLSNVKFLNVINPIENREVTFSISISSANDAEHKVDTVVFNENQQFAKLSMLFTRN
jgi:3-hydroxyacyl-[acyl-carrier-protein] dehydratase